MMIDYRVSLFLKKIKNMFKSIKFFFNGCITISVILLLIMLLVSAFVYHSINDWLMMKHKEQVLIEYAQELPKASEISEHSKKFYSEFQASQPVQKLGDIYNYLFRNWKYVPDEEGQDHFKSATQMFKTRKFVGDCEDFCAVMMAMCRHMGGLETLVCLGQNKTKGHAWIEIKISNEEISTADRKFIERSFQGNVTFVKRNNAFWLQLNPDNDGFLNSYTLTHVISKNGELKPVLQ
jgi:hypothetical protein